MNDRKKDKKMKYLKILPLSLVATLLSQESMALKESTIQRARVEENRQRVEGPQNAILAGLGLPQNANHRAALTALGAGGIGVNVHNVAAAVALLAGGG